MNIVFEDAGRRIVGGIRLRRLGDGDATNLCEMSAICVSPALHSLYDAAAVSAALFAAGFAKARDAGANSLVIRAAREIPAPLKAFGAEILQPSSIANDEAVFTLHNDIVERLHA